VDSHSCDAEPIRLDVLWHYSHLFLNATQAENMEGMDHYLAIIMGLHRMVAS